MTHDSTGRVSTITMTAPHKRNARSLSEQSTVVQENSASWNCKLLQHATIRLNFTKLQSAAAGPSSLSQVFLADLVCRPGF